ncbi:flagellar hook-length control protein FliK [Vibrio sp. M260118]|uniref:flagellar hook-length control protein FliK n=1 Tax=Vibrio sp. M260118 TaxID=3020896 RepID=UPI002F3E912F
MNINLSSVSESPKATPAAVASGEATSESTESGGFFSKLTALIKGEGSSEAKPEAKVDASQTKTKAESEEVSVEGDVEAKSVKTSATESQSADELLSSEEESAKAEKSTKAGESNVDESEAKLPKSAEKIVSENDEVLQRLDHSNKALQPKDGKQLPQHEVVDENVKPGVQSESIVAESKTPTSLKVASESTQETEPLQQNAKLAADQVASGEKVVVTSSEGEEVAVPVSAKRFIDTSDTQQVTTQASQKGEQQVEKSTIAAAGVAAVSMDDVSEQVVDAKAVANDKSQTAVSDEVVVSRDSNANQVDDKPSSQAEESATVASAAMLGGSAVVGATTATSDKGSAEASRIAAPMATGSVVTGVSELEDQVELDPTAVVAGTAVATGAIPWAASEGQAKDDAAPKADIQPKPQQAPVAHSVHQAIVSQQTQAPMAQSLQQQAVTPTMPSDLSALQMQQVAVAQNGAVAQDQAVLKAAMGAKAAHSLGQLAGKKEGQQPGTEASNGFAQQLAQASGQQGPGALGQVRAEQAAQPPLQLNREMAGEQLAERVQMMMSKNLKNIDIRLDPPELGRMQIRMNMNGDAATVHFTVANQQARDVIEQSMPRLREMLAQQGLQLGDSSVQQQASGQQQRRYAEGGQGNNGQGGSNHGFSGEENLEPDINLDLNVASKRDGISYYA